MKILLIQCIIIQLLNNLNNATIPAINVKIEIFENRRRLSDNLIPMDIVFL